MNVLSLDQEKSVYSDYYNGKISADQLNEKIFPSNEIDKEVLRIKKFYTKKNKYSSFISNLFFK